jgi:uncharacterized protein YlxP (DUF503 family)
MSLGMLTLHLHIPGCTSLKEKRSRLKPLVARLHREFNISVAEVGQQDSWQNAILACALVGNESGHVERSLQKIVGWVESYWPDVEVADDKLELY